MKSTIKKKEFEAEVFPKLVVSETGHTVVLATNRTKNNLHGVCVWADPRGNNIVGDYLESWAPECFKDFNGEVTLSN